MDNNEKLFVKRNKKGSTSNYISTIAVVSKPLDIIIASELLYKLNIKSNNVLWVSYRHAKKPAKMAAKYFNNNLTKNVVYLPYPLITHLFYVTQLISIRYIGRVLKKLISFLAYPWWWLAYFYSKHKLRKLITEDIKYYMAAPIAPKLLYASIFRPEYLYLFDGGHSTISRGFLDTFFNDGPEALLKKALKWRSLYLPDLIKKRILTSATKNILFFTSYTEKKAGSVIHNDYNLLKTKLAAKKVEKHVIILGFPAIKNYSILNERIVKLKTFLISTGIEKISYKPHPRELAPYKLPTELEEYNISIIDYYGSIEFYILETKILPEYIIGYDSSALSVFEKLLKGKVKIINLSYTEPKNT